MSINNNDTAVVVGGSLAGMAAAKALASNYKKIFIIEKDKLINGPVAHQGTPQSYHAHTLLKSGEIALEQLFPGIKEELLNSGSLYVDFGSDLKWKHHGNWKTNLPKPYNILMQSRPFLEWNIRKRLSKSENIVFYEETKLIDVQFDLKNKNVSQVTVLKNDVETINLNCDLLIDASGAASVALNFLKKGGFDFPEVSKVKIKLTYTSRNYVCSGPIMPKAKALLIYYGSALTRTGLLFSTETNEVIVSLGGYDVPPPLDNDAFLTYAKNLDSSEIYDIIKTLKPINDISLYRFPEMRRIHYENLKQAPSNMLVVGDAFCRVDPVFGQGMSVAFMEALALKNLLKKNGGSSSLSKAFHKEVAKIVKVPWLLTSLEGFRLKHTTGNKPIPIGMGFLHWYLKKVFEITSITSKTYMTFVEVINLQKSPIHLFVPRIFLQVIKRSIRD